MIIRKIILVGIPLFLMSCAPQSQADRLTLGMVQSSIHGGISGGEVQEALGAPNIISKNKGGNEVWTYDRVSKETTSFSGVQMNLLSVLLQYSSRLMKMVGSLTSRIIPLSFK